MVERERLEALLAESVESAKYREKTAFDELAAPYEKRLVLFGAGTLGRRTLAGLRRLGLEVLCLSDNNPDLWGTDINGVPVVSPQGAAARFANNAAFVITIWNGRLGDTMSKRVLQLENLGCRRVIPGAFLFWKYPETFLPHYTFDLPHKLLEQARSVRAAFECWTDHASQQEYVSQIAFRLNLDFSGIGEECPDHYFPKDIYQVVPGETLVDCGAFDGDTIKVFVKLCGKDFARIVAYEPDKINWVRLQERLLEFPMLIRSRINCFPYALGADKGSIAFDSTGTDMSVSGKGTEQVDCVALDDSLEGIRPTIIKFDIEGAELAALEGCMDTIRRDPPILAISAYHAQSHIWEIPLRIAKASRDYRFFLRPHGTEGVDLVCYAVPTKRMSHSRQPVLVDVVE